MVLSELGKIAEKCWLDIPKHFPNCELDYYVIMPNHIHGIVIINNENQNLGNKKNVGGEIRRGGSPPTSHQFIKCN